MRMIMSVLFAVAGGVIGFFASISFFKGIGYGFLAMLIGVGGPNVMSNPGFMISLHLLVALAVFLLLLQLLSNRLFIPVVKAFPAVYIIAAFSLVMMKSRGVQGVNINPFDIVGQFMSSPATVFFNMSVLIPLGVLFRTRGASARLSVATSVAIPLILEVLQLVFKLGVCDVVDIALNAFGFMFGYCVADAAISSGFRFAKAGRFFYCITRGHK